MTGLLGFFSRSNFRILDLLSIALFSCASPLPRCFPLRRCRPYRFPLRRYEPHRLCRVVPNLAPDHRRLYHARRRRRHTSRIGIVLAIRAPEFLNFDFLYTTYVLHTVPVFLHTLLRVKDRFGIIFLDVRAVGHTIPDFFYL